MARTAFNISLGILAVAGMMTLGGLIHSRKIAEIMSRKITGMNHGQGFAANLCTGMLVNAASLFGLPVPTTRVAVGSHFGIGLTTGKANPKVMLGIVLMDYHAAVRRASRRVCLLRPGAIRLMNRGCQIGLA